MEARKLSVTKIGRRDKIEDLPINFPSLNPAHLRLDLIEVKKKLKSGLPLFTPSSRKGPPPPVIKIEQFQRDIEADKPERVAAREAEDARIEIKVKKHKHHHSRREHKKHKHSHHSRKEEKTHSKKEKKSHSKSAPGGDDDDELVNELGEDEEDSKSVTSSDGGDAASAVSSEDAADGEKKVDEEEEGDDDEEEEDDGLTPEQRIAQEREEYIWRFKILKKKYPTENIPSYNEHDDLSVMKLVYERTLKTVSFDENIEAYRRYLKGLFVGMEFVCTTFLDMPEFKGFAASQLESMTRYDTMLIELGEKSQNRWGLNLPVEVRLLGMVVMSAGVYYVANRWLGGSDTLIKMFFGEGKKDGTAGSAAASGSGAASGPSGGETRAAPPSAPRPSKMKGPSLSMEEINKMR